MYTYLSFVSLIRTNIHKNIYLIPITMYTYNGYKNHVKEVLIHGLGYLKKDILCKCGANLRGLLKWMLWKLLMLYSYLHSFFV